MRSVGIKTALIALIIAAFAFSSVSGLKVNAITRDEIDDSETLSIGSSGERVAELQRELRAVGVLHFSGEPNGVFDEAVYYAVCELEYLICVNIDGRFSCADDAAYRAAVANGSIIPSYYEDMPLYGAVFGLDAGHQQFADFTLEPISPSGSSMRFAMTEGCFGVRTNNRESLISLSIVLKVKALLEHFGACVVLSRDSDAVSVSNRERALMMNENNVDFWLRLHLDHSADARLSGARMLIPNSIENLNIVSQSAKLASCVLENYSAFADTKRLISRSLTSETGFNWSNVPVATLEAGYLSNAASDLAFSSLEYRRRCAEGIALGICEYYVLSGKLGETDFELIKNAIVDMTLSYDNAADPLPNSKFSIPFSVAMRLHGSQSILLEE